MTESNKSRMPKFLATERSANFRSDIAGIRGAAVLMVTLCHFGIPGFSGGFIGPDIFFVLSGYLITRIIYKEFSKRGSSGRRQRTISLSNFYRRRAKRILPASIAVILAVNIYARFALGAAQVQQIKTDSIWALLFGANINFMRQATDYFAQTMAASPLQHYWSLSVEEQFYFVWPLFLLWAAGLKKIKKGERKDQLQNRLIIVFTAFAAISFAWLIFEFTTNPTAAYFSTFGRSWELALGGALGLLPVEQIKNRIPNLWLPLRLLALLALFGSLAIVTPTNFGYLLIVPAVATGFLLLSGQDNSSHDIVHRILSIKPLTAMGTISYSVYLWHWPIAVFGIQRQYFETLTERVIGVFLTIAIGAIGYYLIERPFMTIDWARFLSTSRNRRKRKVKSQPSKRFQQNVKLSGAAVLSVVVLLGYLFYGFSNQDESKNLGWVPPASAQNFAPAVSQGNPFETSQLPVASISLEKAIKSWQRKIDDGVTLKTVPKNLNPNLNELAKIAKFGGWTACAGQREDPVTISNVCESYPGTDAGTKTAILLGDSHGRMLWDALVNSLDATKWHITLLGMPSCPVPLLVPDITSKYNAKCAEHRQATFDFVAKAHPDLLVLSDSVDGTPTVGEYTAAYDAVLPELVQNSGTVLLVENAPRTAKLISCITNETSLAKCKPTKYRVDDLRQVQRKMAVKYSLGYWDLSGALCSATKDGLLCPPIAGTQPVSGDGSHLIPITSKALAPFLMQILKRLNIDNLAITS